MSSSLISIPFHLGLHKWCYSYLSQQVKFKYKQQLNLVQNSFIQVTLNFAGLRPRFPSSNTLYLSVIVLLFSVPPSWSADWGEELFPHFVIQNVFVVQVLGVHMC